MKFISLCLGLLLCTSLIPGTVKAQQQALGYYEQVISASMVQPGGSGRIRGLGGAGVALGGDPSLATLNPAALGMVSNSQWSASAGANLSSSSSEYLGRTTSDLFLNPVLHNLTGAFSFMKDDISEGDWRGGTFGININRIADFTRKFSYEGVNNNNSYIEELAEGATGIPQSTFDSEFDNGQFMDVYSLAYAGFLIDPLPSDNSVYFPIFNVRSTNQKETVTQTGRINSWDFSYGGNYKDKLYLGASLGILGIRFRENKIFEETLLPENPGDESFSYTLNDELTTKGTGVNLGIGVIYKITDWVRLGLSAKTPTYFAMNEKSSRTLTSEFSNLPEGTGIYGGTYTQVPQQYSYNMITPGRLNAGASFIIKKNGFISADVEYLNYSTGRLLTNNNNELSADNEVLKNNFIKVLNYRVGGELRLDIFRLRAGLSYMSNPIDKNSSFTANLERIAYNVGAGIRMRSYFMDMAYSLYSSSNIYLPYTVSETRPPQPESRNSFTNVDFSISFGTFF